jgi:hypothetical protein
MFWWGKRHAVTPFAYAPGGNEAVGEGESGGGFLYEFDPLGKGRTKLGTTSGAPRPGGQLSAGRWKSGAGSARASVRGAGSRPRALA